MMRVLKWLLSITIAFFLAWLCICLTACAAAQKQQTEQKGAPIVAKEGAIVEAPTTNKSSNKQVATTGDSAGKVGGDFNAPKFRPVRETTKGTDKREPLVRCNSNDDSDCSTLDRPTCLWDDQVDSDTSVRRECPSSVTRSVPLHYNSSRSQNMSLKWIALVAYFTLLILFQDCLKSFASRLWVAFKEASKGEK